MSRTAQRDLQIYDPRERWLVRSTDVLLSPLGWFRRRTAPATPVRRILLLRLERIGDLLMVLGAIQDAREIWPEAEIDLAVGVWNEPIARLVAGTTRVEIATAPWLSRARDEASWRSLVATAQGWRARHYDLALNFEPDIRSNALAWLSGARVRVGYSTGGGAAFLTDARPYDPTTHVSVNARRLVARAARIVSTGQPFGSFDAPDRSSRLMSVPPASRVKVDTLLSAAARPFIAVHVSGGRLSKQWHVDRFGALARALAAKHHGTIVLTGDAGDRRLVDEVLRLLPDVATIDTSGTLGLADLAALLSQMDVLVTGDTGPMHLASVVGTPVVALFGPSNPARYGPVGSQHRVVRVDLWCSPCGQVRLPPERCRGHVPDCMDGIQINMVMAAADEILAARFSDIARDAETEHL